MFHCPSTHPVIPHWKCVLCYCYKCPSIFIPIQEANKYKINQCPTIRFRVYRHVSHFTVHGIHAYKERTTCSLCSTIPISDITVKLYT